MRNWGSEQFSRWWFGSHNQVSGCCVAAKGEGVRLSQRVTFHFLFQGVAWRGRQSKGLVQPEPWGAPTAVAPFSKTAGRRQELWNCQPTQKLWMEPPQISLFLFWQAGMSEFVQFCAFLTCATPWCQFYAHWRLLDMQGLTLMVALPVRKNAVVDVKLSMEWNCHCKTKMRRILLAQNDTPLTANALQAIFASSGNNVTGKIGQNYPVWIQWGPMMGKICLMVADT